MENDLYDIKEILPIFEPYVKRLEVDELLPHVEMVVGAEKSRLFPIQKNCVVDTDTETVSRLFDTFNVSLLKGKSVFYTLDTQKMCLRDRYRTKNGPRSSVDRHCISIQHSFACTM